MSKTSPYRKIRAEALASIRNVVIGAVLLLALLVWQLRHEMPGFLRLRLERALSAGAFTVRFDKASLDFFSGVTIENVRVNMKRSLDPPIAQVGRLRLRGHFNRDKPLYAWVSDIEATDITIRPVVELEIAGGDDAGSVFAEYLRHSTRDNDWFSDPVNVTLHNADVFAVKCRGATFRLSARNEKISADSIVLDINSRGFDETISGWASLSVEPFEARSRLYGTLTHEVVTDFIAALEGRRANKILSLVGPYSAPLQVSGELYWSAPKGVPSTQDLRFAAAGNGVTFNGQRLERMRTVVQWVSAPSGDGVEKRFVVSPVEFATKDGAGTFAAVWRPIDHSVDMTVKANAMPSELARIFAGRSPEFLTNFVFSSTPEVAVASHMSFTDTPSSAHGSFAAKKAHVMGVPMTDVNFDFEWLENSHLSFPKASASLFDGNVSGTATLTGDLKSFHADVALSKLDCAKARRHFTGNDLGAGGTIDATVRLSGETGERAIDTLSGSAAASINGARILRLPLFAGLTDFIGRNVPGIDLLLMQSDAKVSCTATNGLVEVERLSVSGNLMSLVASGKCRLNKEGTPVEMISQLRFFHSQSLIGRLARLVTIPVSKMIEFRVSGPIASPNWDYVGLIDRIVSIFKDEEDATALPEPKPDEGK